MRLYPGHVVLFRFPQTDFQQGKLRPALAIAPVPGEFDDWLLCMISSQLRHYVAGFDELINEEDTDFPQTGLKMSSVVSVGRLAIASPDALVGVIGHLSDERLLTIKAHLRDWLA